jgi:site-specific recombinase XerD
MVRKGKGNKERQLFLCDRLHFELRRFRRSVLGGERSPLFCALTRNGNGKARDGRISQCALVDVVHHAARGAGITRKVNPMTLRHTFATHMYQAGVHVRDIKEMMGHDNKSETGIYIHITLDSMRVLLNKHAATRWLKEGTAL